MANKDSELLAVVQYFEKTRNMKREFIVQAIESAMVKVAAKHFGVTEDAVKVVIDRTTFAVKAFRRFTVALEADPSNPAVLPIEQARRLNKDVIIGDTIECPVRPEAIGRIGAQNARQVILQNIRNIERENVATIFRDRIGEIVSGTVRQTSRRGDLFVEIDGAEALLPSRETIPHETIEIGDTIRAIVLKIQDPKEAKDSAFSQNGPAVILSRTSSSFLRALFVREVSEIADGTVEIMGVSRDPGVRAKLAVRSHDDKVDPVGSCVGIRGVRVRNIVNELHGEKVDIVRWHEDIREYAQNALSPAKLAGVEVVSEDPLCLEAYVNPDQMKLALGKHHQNVSLARRLIGCKIEIRPTEPEGDKFEMMKEDAINSLLVLNGVTREEAEALVNSGYTSVDAILAAQPKDIAEDTGLPFETANRIWQTAVSPDVEI